MATRVRRIVEGGELLVLELAPNLGFPPRSGNAQYLLDAGEYEEMERNAALGKAIMERTREILAPPDIQPQSNFDDVGDFHRKFTLYNVAPGESAPQFLATFDEELFKFRFKFLHEELYELRDGWQAGDLSLVADALVDLVYVAMGTAHLLGLPWQELWDEVQRANMSKIRASTADESARSSGRGHASDVLKGPNFVPPDVRGILERHGFQVTWPVPPLEEEA